MKKRTVYTYYNFGECVRFLIDIRAGFPVHEDGSVMPNLKWVLESIRALGLVVTEEVARDLITFRDELNNLPRDSTITNEQSSKLSKIMVDVRKVLSAELKRHEAFIITPKILDVARLIDDVPSLFAPDVFSNLPEIARYDFTEAGKCIAFERPTSSAFHILRGTESVLRHFYCSLVRHKRISSLMWGPVTQDLRKRPKTAKYETLYNNLDNIRVSFRNPTRHPEKIYDIHEAQDLWALCVEATNRMMRIISA
jgi:hypothetical protein